MKVLILHTLPPDVLPEGRERLEFDLTIPAQSVAAVLPNAVVEGVRGDPAELIDLLSRVQPNVVFNICETPLGRADLEAHCAALFEWLDVPFTGSGSATLTLCRRKDQANAILSACGIAVPRSEGFPCIVKPAGDDASVGIHRHSVCADGTALERARTLIAGPVVVQEFLAGREFAVSLWGSALPESSAVGEVCFTNGLQLITYAAKWLPSSDDYANSPVRYDTEIAAALRAAIVDTAVRAWRALGLRGYARVDVRLDGQDVPHVLDVNPNPDLSPGAGMQRAIAEAGWTWEQFVARQIEWASTFARS